MALLCPTHSITIICIIFCYVLGNRGCLKMFKNIRNAFSHPTMTIETTTWLAAISILKVVV